MPVPAGIDEAGGGVDQQPEPSKTRLPLQAGDQVVRQRNAFERRTEDELAGVKDERLVAFDLDLLRQFLLRLLDVDVRVARVVEDPEVLVHADVDARRLQQRDVIRVDPDAPLGDEPFDGDVA